MGNSWSGACLNTAFITDFHLNWSEQTTKQEILVNSIKLFINTYKHIIPKKIYNFLYIYILGQVVDWPLAFRKHDTVLLDFFLFLKYTKKSAGKYV